MYSSNIGEMYVLIQTHGRDVCTGSNMQRCMYWFKHMGEMYVLVQTHGRDVCIGSNTWEDVCIGLNMGEILVLVQTWKRCMHWFKCLPIIRIFTFCPCNECLTRLISV